MGASTLIKGRLAITQGRAGAREERQSRFRSAGRTEGYAAKDAWVQGQGGGEAKHLFKGPPCLCERVGEFCGLLVCFLLWAAVDLHSLPRRLRSCLALQDYLPAHMCAGALVRGQQTLWQRGQTIPQQ